MSLEDSILDFETNPEAMHADLRESAWSSKSALVHFMATVCKVWEGFKISLISEPPEMTFPSARRWPFEPSRQTSFLQKKLSAMKVSNFHLKFES